MLPSERTGSVLEDMTKVSETLAASPVSKIISNNLADVRSGIKQNVSPLIKSMAKGQGSEAGRSLKDYEFSNDQLTQDMMLKNIRASAAISDLMANDEVIGAHHPEDVAFHFNEISNIAPDTSTNVAMMRPLLRKRLEGGGAAIDPTDVQQMLDMEKVKSETRKSRAQTSGLLKDITGRS